MPKNKHTAYLPDNSVATRSTESRIYPFCVAERPSYEIAVSNALAQGDRAYVRSEYDWAVRETGPNAKYPNIHGPAELERLKKIAALSFQDYVAQVIADQLARVEKLKAEGYYESWKVVGWSGRRDLAEKLANSRRAMDSVADVRVVCTNYFEEGM